MSLYSQVRDWWAIVVGEGPTLVSAAEEVLSEKGYVYDEIQPVRRSQSDEEYLRQKDQFTQKC